MRIKKVSQVVPIVEEASIVDAYSTSTTNGYSCNYVNGLNTFSTTEARIGTWIDGKPLYAKTFEATGPSGTSSSAVSLFDLPANTDRVWLDAGNSYWYNSSTIKPVLTLNWFYNTDDWCRVSIYATDVRVRTGPNVNLTSFKYSITLKYTKTTD